MRRRYIVISSFFVAILLLTLLCYGSYRYAEQVARENSKEQQEETQETGAAKEQKITGETKYIVETYNKESEKLTREERSLPEEYAGMTRQDVEKYLALCRDTMASKDWEAGLSEIKLVSFSGEELVIRKIYQEPEQEEGFVLKLSQGEVVIYHPDGKTVYERTGIYQEDLLADEIKKLKKGYRVKDEKELYSILENFSS